MTVMMSMTETYSGKRVFQEKRISAVVRLFSVHPLIATGETIYCNIFYNAIHLGQIAGDNFTFKHKII